MACRTVLAPPLLVLLGSWSAAAPATLTARLPVGRSGQTLSSALTLSNHLGISFRAGYVCTPETFLVNSSGKVVRQDPPADAACQSTYRWLNVPARSLPHEQDRGLEFHVHAPPRGSRALTRIESPASPSPESGG